MVVILSILAGIVFWKLSSTPQGLNQADNGVVKLTYWGFDDEVAVEPLISRYQKDHPNVTIEYSKQSLINYNSRLQAQIKASVGPDIFKIHNSWTQMLAPYLAPAPGSILTPGDYQTAFYPVVSESFVINNKILGVPSTIDGLVLFYNPQILSAGGVGVPQTWTQLISAATKVTVRDSSGQIKTAGVALGSTNNVDYWPDILGLLLLQQPGVNLNTPSNSAADVLTFYAGFVTDPSKKTWDINLSNSTEMFLQGNLAFYFAPASKAEDLKKANPNLQFATTPVPQLPNRNVGWASFWGEGVSKTSKHQLEAWKFAKFLSDADVDKQKPLINDTIYRANYVQGPYYKDWYLNSNTQDSSINDEMIGLWQNGVNQVLSGQSSQGVVTTIASSQKKIFEKYNIATTSK